MTWIGETTISRLIERLDEITEQKVAELVGGVAQDFADYRGRAAYLKALRDVKTEIVKVQKDITGR
jgi:hypothetical protein